MKILGVCAGNGASTFAFKKHLIGNLEPRAVFHTAGDLQWNENYEGIPLYRKEDQLYDDIKRVDAIFGHPDCGHSSMLALSRGKKMTDPKQNTSLMMFIHVCQYYKPKVWLMENLPAMLKNVTQEWFEEQFPQYTFMFIEGAVTLYGNSQLTRKRVVILATRKSKYLYPITLFKNYNAKTVGELLRNMGGDDHGWGHVREDHDKMISMYSGQKNRISVKKAQRLWKGRLKGKRRNEVNRAKMSNQPGVYRNLKDHYPLTVTKGDRQFNPQGLPMSPRELARIQGVPDKFNIYIDPKNKQYWVNKGRTTFGKSAPYEIGKWFLEHLSI